MGVNKDDVLRLTEGLENLLKDPTFDPTTLDHATRRRISEAARKVSLATEARGDTVHRIAHSPCQLPLALVGLETGIFEKLSDLNGAATSNAELAEKTGVDPGLMKRFLRYYQSFGLVSQSDDDQYQANNITRALASPAGRSALPFIHSMMVPALNALPRFLRENKGIALTDPAHIPWYLGHNTTAHPFKWLNERPEVLKNFMGWMTWQRDGLPDFLSVVDFAAEFAKGAEASTPVFVDVGGSMGHQCIALRRKYPDLVGRVVLQDLPESIEKAKANPLPGFEGVEALEYDFFTPQLLKGARAYYMRNVLHDWPDEKCVEILQNLKGAMTSESRILVDEMILPEKDTPWRATQQDFIMASTAAARERSQSDWLALFDRAGLRIERQWKYTDELSDHLIALVPA
ncbi:S-adenosyl-L-methionine-dependent methyltransferase [Xylaria intraflava]|nr:S-adenosyl-L-methionine-dependent methyltransferase [Xylaria intraflava]